MAFVDDLLVILGSYPEGYRLMRRRLYGPVGLPDLKHLTHKHGVHKGTFKTTIYRLKRRGLLEKNNKLWRLTQKGKQFMERILERTEYKNLSKRKKNMIIIFDIPQSIHKKRHWLRQELSCLGFSPIQKSVWFGPAPLPKTFIEHLHKVQLLPCLKFFKANEYDII